MKRGRVERRKKRSEVIHRENDKKKNRALKDVKN